MAHHNNIDEGDGVERHAKPEHAAQHVDDEQQNSHGHYQRRVEVEAAEDEHHEEDGADRHQHRGEGLRSNGEVLLVEDVEDAVWEHLHGLGVVGPACVDVPRDVARDVPRLPHARVEVPAGAHDRVVRHEIARTHTLQHKNIIILQHKNIIILQHKNIKILQHKNTLCGR